MKSITLLLFVFLTQIDLFAQTGKDNLTLAFDMVENDKHAEWRKFRIYDSGTCVVFTFVQRSGIYLSRPHKIDTIRFSGEEKFHVTYNWVGTSFKKTGIKLLNDELMVTEYKLWDYDRNGNLEAWYIAKNDFDAAGRIIKYKYDSLSATESISRQSTFTYYPDSIVSIDENKNKTVEYSDSISFYGQTLKKVNFEKIKTLNTVCFYTKNGNLRILDASTELGFFTGGRKQSTSYYKSSNHIESDENGFITRKVTRYDETKEYDETEEWKITLHQVKFEKIDARLMNYLGLWINENWIYTLFPGKSFFPIHFNGQRKKGNLIAETPIDDEIDTSAMKILALNESNIEYPNGTIIERRSDQCLLLDRMDAPLSSFTGLIPVIDIKNVNDPAQAIVSNYLVMSGGKFEITSSNTKLNPNDPLVSIGDPADPSTWKDSVNKNGERVYGTLKQFHFKLKDGKFGLLDAMGKIIIDTLYQELLVLQVSPEEKFKSDAHYSELVKTNGVNLPELNGKMIYGYVGVSKEGYKLFDKNGKPVFNEFFDKISVTKTKGNYFLTLTSGKTKITLDQLLQKIP